MNSEKLKTILLAISLIITISIGISIIGVYPYRLSEAERQIKENSENIAKLQQFLFENNLILLRIDERSKQMEDILRSQ